MNEIEQIILYLDSIFRERKADVKFAKMLPEFNVDLTRPVYNSIIINYYGEISCSSYHVILFLAYLQNIFLIHAGDTDGYAQTRQIALSSPCDPRCYPLRKYLSIPRPYTLEII